MNQYDKFVNNVLSSLIFEQSDQINPENIIQQSVEDFQKNKENSSLLSQSESKYNQDGEIVGLFSDYIDQVKNELKTQKVQEDFMDDLKSGASWLWGKTKEGLKKTEDVVAPTMESVTDYVVNNVGDWTRKIIGDKYVDEINNEMSETLLYKIAATFEPTGVMSWPYLNNALKLYEEHKGTEDEDIYFLNLLAAQISVIPGAHVPISILTFPLKVLGKGVFAIFGGAKFLIAREIAGVIKGFFTKNKNIPKVAAEIERIEVSGARMGFLGKAKKFFSSFFKPVLKVIKPVLKGITKTVPAAAKIATVTSSGDIPKTLEDLENLGKKAKSSGGIPKQSTLGKFPSFSSLSTQSF